MSTLSAYMAAAGSRPLPAEILELTKHHLLDTLAAMVSGSRLAPGKAALSFAQISQGGGPCTIVASSIQCGAIEAALLNGVLAHADETDDSHSPSLSHPGCAVVPAALACGENFPVDGSRFLRAIALGYDIGPRVTGVPGKFCASERHKKLA
jgi:2-methylcitrate dehydratase PrpD